MARRRLLFSYFYIEYNGNKYGESVVISPFPETGGTDTFKIVSSKPWSVVDYPSWAVLDVLSANKGETTVTITVNQNTDITTKTGNIIIKTIDDRYTATLSLKQLGSEPFIYINNIDSDVEDTVTFRDENQTYTITSRGGWTLSMVGDASASRTDYSSEGVGSIDDVISYSKNNTSADKVFVATLTSKADPTIVRTITITQKAQSNVDLNYNGSQVIPYNGETNTIDVATNIGANIEIPSTAQSHIALSKVSNLEDGDVVNYTASTLDSTQTAESRYTYTIIAKTTDFSSDDNIDSDFVSFVYEPYPYIDINQNINIGSATTSDSINYSSNYPVSAYNMTAGVTVVINNGTITYTLPTNTSWTDVDYSFTVPIVAYSNLHQDGVRGPVISKNITITRQANVAYIDASNQSVNSNAGVYFVDVDTNDEFSVSIPQGVNWITLSSIEGNRVFFNVLENEGVDARDTNITFITVHNGPNGQPAEKEITFTQASPGITVVNVYPDVELYQDSTGDWWMEISHSEQGVELPMTFEYNGDTVNVSASTTSQLIQTNWNTAVGTAIDPSDVSYTDEIISGATQYDIACAINVTEYSEEVEIDEVSVDISYDTTVIPASGGVVEPTITVYYTATTTPSFGQPETIEGETTFDDYSIEGDGDFYSDGSVSADSRGTESGDTINIATVTGITGTITINGTEFSISEQVTEIEIDQQENTYDDVWDYEGATVESGNVDTDYLVSYENVEVDIVPDGGSFDATGGTIGVTAYESYDELSTEIFTYDDTITSSWTVTRTYTSGEEEEREEYDYDVVTGLTKEGETTTTPYTDVDITTAITQTTTNEYMSYSDGDVIAENLGTTETTGETLTLYVESTVDSEYYDSEDFIQEANECTVTTSGMPMYDSAITDTYPEVVYEDISVTINASEDEFLANGETPNGETEITVSASESYTEVTNIVNEITESSWTVTVYTSAYTSGEIITDPIAGEIDSATTLTTASTTTSAITHDITTAITQTTTNDHMYYSNGVVTADDLGTDITQGETLTLEVSCSVDSSYSDSVDITQEANAIESTGWTTPTESSEITDCEISVDNNAVLFNESEKSVDVIVTSTVDVTTSLMAYPYSAYTSGQEELGPADIISASTQTIPVEPEWDWSDEGEYTELLGINITEIGGGDYTATFGATYSQAELASGGYIGSVHFTNDSGTCESEDVTVDIEPGTPQNSLSTDIDESVGAWCSVGIGMNEEYAGTGIYWKTTFEYDITLRPEDGTEDINNSGYASITGQDNDNLSLSCDRPFNGPVVRYGANCWFDYDAPTGFRIIDITIISENTTITS